MALVMCQLCPDCVPLTVDCYFTCPLHRLFAGVRQYRPRRLLFFPLLKVEFLVVLFDESCQ
jgi:hypothetical protein